MKKRKDIDLNIYEQAFISPVTQVTIELKEYIQRFNEIKAGYVYLLFRRADEKIKVGFTKSIYDLEKNESNNGFMTISNRAGSHREVKLLMETLSELGYNQIKGEGEYYYSKSLLKHLYILGWPVGEKVRPRKKYCL